MSQPQISRAEAGKLITLSVIDASRIAAAVGLDLSIRTYPGSRRPRDAPSLNRLRAFLANARPPLAFRLEVPLPSTGPYPEQRAWDAVLEGDGAETAIELEARLYDFQAQTRRILLKQRDDPGKGLLLVVANTVANRRVLEEHGDMLARLSRLRTRDVVAALSAGKHPPTGIVLF